MAGVEDRDRTAAARVGRGGGAYERLAEIDHALVALAQRSAAAGRGGDEDRPFGDPRQQRLSHLLARGELAVVQVERAATALLGPGDHVVAGDREGVDRRLLCTRKSLAHDATAQHDGLRAARAPALPGHVAVAVERSAAAARRSRHDPRERSPDAQRGGQEPRAAHEREQRAHLQRRRLRTAVTADLEQLAVAHVGRAGHLARTTAEAAVERLACLLDRELARNQALHDVDAAAGAVRLGLEQVERGAGWEAQAARHALARERVEALAPFVGEVEGGHPRTAPSTAATSSGLAYGAGRAGVNACRA